MKLKVKRLNENAMYPTQATECAAGFDLYAHRVEEYDNHFKIFTGIAIQPEAGYFTYLHPRSSLTKKGLTLYNCTGVIDEDYRGEIIGVLLKTADYKHANEPKPGDRLFQLVVQKYHATELEFVTELGESERGTGGFGSSGQ